eukprot:gene20927-27124_t
MGNKVSSLHNFSIASERLREREQFMRMGHRHSILKAFCRIVDESLSKVVELRKIVDTGSIIPSYGQKADEICNSAFERFSAESPIPDIKGCEAIFDKKIEDLEKVLDAPLHVIYLKQLGLLRDKALKTFKSLINNSKLADSNGNTENSNEYEAVIQVDDTFRREAEESTRQSPEWDYTKEVSYLKLSLNEIASKVRKASETIVQAAKQNQNAMQFLQMQSQQLAALQQQLQGASSPWSAALAYRVPDSNINLSYNYQQGRNNIQISCVPDEAVPLLGPNGFVQGVTPGNIGLSFNINV